MTPGLWINDVTINCQEPPFFSILLFKVCTENNENKDKHRYCDNFQYDFCNFSHYLVISLQRFLVSLAASLLGAYSKTDWPAIRDLTYTILWLISVSNTPNLYLFKASLASRLGVVPTIFFDINIFPFSFRLCFRASRIKSSISSLDYISNGEGVMGMIARFEAKRIDRVMSPVPGGASITVYLYPFDSSLIRL